MATAEELLAGVSSVDSTLTISNDLRTIVIPPSIKNLGVESDDEVLKLNFKMPRYIGDIDLSAFAIQINYRNAQGEGDIYEVTDAVADAQHITFSWLVAPIATRCKGRTTFNVCLRAFISDGSVDKEYNTTIATLPVLEGLEVDGNAIVESNPDLLEQWRRELFGIGDTEEASIRAASQAEQAAIANKGAEVLATIPLDYQTAIGMIRDADTAYNPESTNAQSGNAVAEAVGEIVNVAFAVGSINGNDGSHTNSTSGNASSLARGRSWFINAKDVIRVEADSGYKIYIHCYDEVMAYCGNTSKLKLGASGWLQDIQMSEIRKGYPNLSYIRVLLKKDTNSNFTETLGDAYGKVRLVKSKISSVKHESFGLPCVYLMGDTSGMSKTDSVALNFKYFDNFTPVTSGENRTPINEYTGQCEVKWQGTSSVRRGYPKRNYTIKFAEGVEFKKSFGAQKKFCLKANWIDPSAMRNILGANRWCQMVANRLKISNPTDYATLPLYIAPYCGAVYGFPVILYINGEFEGLYTFNIAKDGWMFNMGTGTSEYIVGAESNNRNSCGFLSTPTFDGDEKTQNLDFSVEYKPDGVDDSTVIESFNRMVNAVKDVPNSAEWETAVEQYLDVGSAIDYLILICCIGGYDNSRKNILYATYDGIKWIMSAYDMDVTFGINVYGESTYDVNNGRNIFREVSNATWNRLFYLIYTYKRKELVERYKYFRTNFLADEAMWAKMSSFTAMIPRIAYDADAQRWPTMPSTSVSNMHNYMDYYRMHCAYLDREIEALEATLTSTAEE